MIIESRTRFCEEWTWILVLCLGFCEEWTKLGLTMPWFFLIKLKLIVNNERGFWVGGMRVKIAMETEDSSRMTWFQGTVSSACASENGPWRMLQVFFVCVVLCDWWIAWSLRQFGYNRLVGEGNKINQGNKRELNVCVS